MPKTAAYPTSETPRPKVLVSGCFDLLHNGHVEFFKEASTHGDLYVRCGKAANIKKLKNHDTMYSDEERVYMIGAIGCVHDAGVSAGWGMFDYLEDAKLIKPDIYFVNEDASQLDERMDKFASIGLSPKIVVAERKPSEGLAGRSSTDMKGRLKEMVLEQEAPKQLERLTAAVGKLSSATKRACVEELGLASDKPAAKKAKLSDKAMTEMLASALQKGQ